MLEKITIVLFWDFSWKKEEKDMARPGLRDGNIAIVEDTRVPKREDFTISLKHTISWTLLSWFSAPCPLENKIKRMFGNANKPKMQGINGSLKKKLYFKVNKPKTPEKTIIENIIPLDCQLFSWKIRKNKTRNKTKKIKIYKSENNKNKI